MNHTHVQHDSVSNKLTGRNKIIKRLRSYLNNTANVSGLILSNDEFELLVDQLGKTRTQSNKPRTD